MFFRDPEKEELKKKVQEYLLNMGNPRLQMFFILIMTYGLAFLFASFLYHMGFVKMWLRYSLTVLFAYFVFYLCVKSWIRIILSRGKVRFNQILDQFEDSLDVKDSLGEMIPVKIEAAVRSANSGGVKNFFDFDLDESFLWVILIVILAALVFVFGYMIFIAPIFVSDMIFESLVMAGLYRKVKYLQQENWSSGFIKKTWIPFTILFAVFLIAGYVTQLVLPEAETIRDVFKHLLSH